MAVYGTTTQKEALSGSTSHKYYMSQCAEYGFPEEFFQKNILYFDKKDPENVSDIPKELRKQVAVNRLKHLTGEDDIPEKVLSLMSNLTGGLIINDAASACGIEPGYWDTYENTEFVLSAFLEDQHLYFENHNILYILFDTSMAAGAFSIRTSEKGIELLEWIGMDSSVKLAPQTIELSCIEKKEEKKIINEEFFRETGLRALKATIASVLYRNRQEYQTDKLRKTSIH